MLTYLDLIECLTYLEMQLLFFLTLSLFWPFKATSLPKTLLTLPALSFHRQFFFLALSLEMEWAGKHKELRALKIQLPTAI